MTRRFISDQSAFDLTYDIANAFRNAGDDVCLVSGRFGKRLRGDVTQEKITPYDNSSIKALAEEVKALHEKLNG